MPTAEARVPTDRAGRYLVQLCRHASRVGQHRGHRPHPHGGGGGAPFEVRHVAWSDTVGTVRFGRGRCVLHATEEALLLVVDADDEGSLQWLTEGISSRLEAMGRRDQLAVDWRRPDSAPGLGSGATSGATGAPISTSAACRRRGLSSTLLTGVVVLVIVVHLGLLGGALAASAWARWASDIVLAVVALKVIVVSVHLLLGRLALRRGVGWGKAFAARPTPRRSPPDSAHGGPEVARHSAGTVKQEHP
jgi:hypothetical protein